MVNQFFLFNRFIILFFFLITIGCTSNDAYFEHSSAKEEAQSKGSLIFEYVPDKNQFDLLDGTKMRIDTAWTEQMFTRKDKEMVHEAAYGYHFGIPYKIEDEKKFSFTFNLADTANRVFTNGMEKKICFLCPRVLYDVILVTLEQKNPDSSIGWLQPITTDTLTFVKVIKTSQLKFRK